MKSFACLKRTEKARQYWKQQVWNFTSLPEYSIPRLSFYSCKTSRIEEDKALLFFVTVPSQDWGTLLQLSRQSQVWHVLLLPAWSTAWSQQAVPWKSPGFWEVKQKQGSRDSNLLALNLLAGLEVDFLPPLKTGEVRKKSVSKQDLPFFKLMKLHHLVYWLQ